MTCDKPPKGWICIRNKDHDGSCAAIRDDSCRLCGAPAGSPPEEHWRRMWIGRSKFSRGLTSFIKFPFWLIYIIGKQTDWEYEHWDEGLK